MKRIPLHTRDGSVRAFALVDDEDFDKLGHLRWYLSNGYVRRNLPRDAGPRRGETLHRELMGLTPGDGLEVDHKNGDKLDNRRQNLRVTDDAGNAANLHGPRASRFGRRTSRFRGVCLHRPSGKWRATVRVNGRQYSLGHHDDEEAAAEVVAAFRREHMPTSEMDRSTP